MAEMGQCQKVMPLRTRIINHGVNGVDAPIDVFSANVTYTSSVPNASEASKNRYVPQFVAFVNGFGMVMASIQANQPKYKTANNQNLKPHLQHYANIGATEHEHCQRQYEWYSIRYAEEILLRWNTYQCPNEIIQNADENAIVGQDPCLVSVLPHHNLFDIQSRPDNGTVYPRSVALHDTFDASIR